MYVKTFFYATLVTLITACGGSGGSDSTPQASGASFDPDYFDSVGGIWHGTIRYFLGGPIDTIGLISEDGELHLIDSNGLIFVSALTKQGNYISATGTYYATGGEPTEGEIDGFMAARQNFNGLLTHNEFAIDEITYDYQKDMYERTSSLEKISGIYSDQDADNAETYVIDSDGAFHGSDDSGCFYNGQVSIIDTRYNMYRITITVSNCGDDIELEGLATLYDVDSTADTLVMSVRNDEDSLSGVLSRN